MNSKKQIGKNIIALLLFVALMWPSVIQFYHLLEDHEHATCTEQKSHIHKCENQCNIHLFHLGSFNDNASKYFELTLQEPPVNKEVNSFTSLQFHSFKTTNTQLRAPPIYS